MTLPLVLLNRRRIGGFNPRAILAGSTAFLWLDPSDLTTMFQDAAGTTPVTAPAQPVGRILDKSQGLVLGPELVTNGDFSGGLTGWTNGSTGTGTATAPSGSLVISGTDASNRGIASQGFATTVGRTYIVTFAVISGVGNSVIAASTSAGASFNLGFVESSSQNRRFYFVATSTLSYVNLYTSGSATVSLDNISVRELPGNHATQATAASRPTYGVVPQGGRRNLLTYTEQFNNGVWSKTGITISPDDTTAPDNTTTADKLVEDTSTGAHRVNPTTAPTIVSGLAYTATVYAKAAERTQIRLTENATTGAFASFDILNGTVLSTGLGGSGAITSAGNGWYRCELRFTSAGTFGRIDITLSNSGSISYTGVAGSGAFIWGAQLETGTTATNYQRVVTAFDVTEAGVPSLSYLSFDGVDDFLVTPTITPGTDKAQVFAGVRKLSDAATGMVCEFSPNASTNAGTFWMAAPIGAGAANYDFSSKGTTGQPKSRSGFAAPHSAVLTGLGDISADSVNLRVNGNDAGAFGGDQGTGNFLAYPLYIGRRAGTSLPFNGQIYGLIVRFGANLDANTITNTETWVNGRTGAF